MITKKHTVVLDKGKKATVPVVPDSVVPTSHPTQRLVFSEAEQLLLDEARRRFDFEQKSSAALHSKSTLFLTLTGVFAALIAASISRLLDRAPNSFLEIAALSVFGLSIGLLTVSAIMLGRSALSRSYQVIATPALWMKHLAALREDAKGSSDLEHDAFIRLQHDILDAWIEASEACRDVNEVKASVLERVSKLLSIAVPIAFLGVLLLLLHTLTR